MLRIHTGLRKLSKTNVYDLHIKKMIPFDIGKPCINIASSEFLFDQYKMALNWDKYDIEIQNDVAIKRNRIFFDFMQRTFNILYGLYLRERCLLIDVIMKDQLRKQSAAEIEKLNREKRQETKERKVHLSLLQKKHVVNKTTRTSRETSSTSNSNFNSYISHWTEASIIE